MPRPKKDSTESKAPRRKKGEKAFEEPKAPKKRAPKYNTTPPEGVESTEPKYRGPWHKVTADPIASKTFIGRVDLGTYTQKEVDKGVLALRLTKLEAQGYQNINVRITAGDADADGDKD